MAELSFVTPIVKTIFDRLIDFLKDETLSIFNLKDELERMERKMRKIMSIIKNVEKKSLNDDGVHIQMTDLKDIAYDIDDMIDDCKVKALALASTSSGDSHYKSFSRLKNLRFSRKIGKRIKKINAKLEEIAEENKQEYAIAPNFRDEQQSNNGERIIRQTTRLVPSDLVGCAEEDAEKLIKLMLEENESGGRTCVNLAILGMGGIGKTTLAQKIFDNVTQSGQFQQKMWICVSKDFKETDIVKEIVRKAGGDYGNGETLDELTDALEKAVRGKKFFLVLDDVWEAYIWNSVLKVPLKSGAIGSKVVITTREANTAKKVSALHFHHVKPLSIEEGWCLLRNNVFKTENEKNTSEQFKDVGVRIIEKCGRLPLAIKAIAGILKTKDKMIGEWEKIISNEVWTQNIFANDDNVMKVLYLSYEHLPYQLKQCFVYCSLFPEDYNFDKEELGPLWIAEGLLGDKVTIESGENLFKELVNRNLLQQDYFYSHHKLHDLLRSLGQRLGEGEYFCGNLTSVRHLYLQGENSLIDDRAQKLDKKLRTLILFKGSELKVIPKSVFQKLKYLRVLSLAYTKIDVIPDSIKCLLHLRYLDLRNSKITIIPESISYLKSLQFLLAERCRLLKKFPKSITSLQNLMLLDNRGSLNPIEMPKGLGRLKKLEKLIFKVGENDSEAKLGEIRSLNLLRHLEIKNLQQNQSLEEARSVELVRKSHLQKLRLSWKHKENVSDEDSDRVTEVFEELRPSSSLSDLDIENFYGRNLPNWMSCSNGVSLNNLVKLEINGCERCQRLPGFGELPQLEILEISEASSIKKIGPEFLGREDRSTDTGFSVRPFAKLERMILSGFSELEEWHWDDDKDGGTTTPFSCLQYLDIAGCPKLKSLPEGLRHATSLVQVELEESKDLERIPGLPTVKKLFIINCSPMQNVGNLNSLEELKLFDVKLGAIPPWLRSLLTSRSKGLSSTSSFRELHITTGDVQLLRRLCPWDIGLDWPLIKDVPRVDVDLFGQLHYVRYTKSPFYVEARLPDTGFIRYSSPTEFSWIYKMKYATTAQAEVFDITPITTKQLFWNIKPMDRKKRAKYSKLRLGFHKHLKITTVDGRTRVTCIHESYFDEPAFVPFDHPLNHTHLPYRTNQGETGMACLHLNHMHPEGLTRSQASSSTS